MKNFITGSDLSAIIGLNPYKTPYAVWASIVNSRGEKEPELAIKISKSLQPVIAQLFSSTTGNTVVGLMGDVSHPTHKHIKATPYGFYYSTKLTEIELLEPNFSEGAGVLQTYGTQKFIERDFIPQHWYLKIIWDMGVTGKKHGTVAWLERGLRFKHAEVQFDEELFSHMLQVGLDFWKEHVETKIPPKAITRSDIKSIYRKHSDLKFVPADEQSYDEVKRMKSLLNEKQFIESELDNIRASLEVTMGDAEGLTYGDKVIATWKNEPDNEKLNDIKLKLEHPSIYEYYCTKVAGKRKFKIVK